MEERPPVGHAPHDTIPNCHAEHDLRFQAANGFRGAAAEVVGFHTHPLGQCHKQIGKRRVVLGIVRYVGAVTIASTGQQDRQVVPIVRRSIAEIRSEQNRAVVKQRTPLFIDRTKLSQKAFELAKLRFLDQSQFFDLRFVLAVMRQIVKA